MALCHFIRVDSRILTSFTTPRLLQNTLAGPSIGTPNTRSLYRNAMIMFQHMHSATNSLPKIDPSTVFSLLENHMIGMICSYVDEYSTMELTNHSESQLLA
jgi:hypothetical protein